MEVIEIQAIPHSGAIFRGYFRSGYENMEYQLSSTVYFSVGVELCPCRSLFCALYQRSPGCQWSRGPQQPHSLQDNRGYCTTGNALHSKILACVSSALKLSASYIVTVAPTRTSSSFRAFWKIIFCPEQYFKWSLFIKPEISEGCAFFRYSIWIKRTSTHTHTHTKQEQKGET